MNCAELGSTPFSSARWSEVKSPIIARSISTAKGVSPSPRTEWTGTLPLQIVRQPIDALTDPGIFKPVSQQHRRVALHGEVVAAVPGDRLVVARVRLLRCGRRLPRILIDLCLPSFGCGGADRRVSLAQHVPAGQQRSKALGDIVVPAKLFATPTQLRRRRFQAKVSPRARSRPSRAWSGARRPPRRR